MDAPSNSKSLGLKFAEQQMQRHGWTEGKGLGKREDGISEAIKVKVKCGTAGVGHNSAEQFTFHWWDHVFNKTVSSISVEPDQDGVKVKRVSEDDGTVSSKKPRKAFSRNMVYGRFIKSATLMSGGEQPVEEVSSCQDTSEDEDSKLDLSSATKLSDEDLVKICGGRTAHKGARHGVTMNAKLSRIEEQERAFMEKYGKKETKLQPPKSTYEINGDDKKRKKKKKHRAGNVDEEQNGNLSNTEGPKKKKKKHKKEDGEESMEAVANGHEQEQVPSMEEDTMALKKKKQKKGAIEELVSVVANGHDQEPNDMTLKKKRSKVPEIDEDHSDVLSVENKTARPPKKKKKPVEREESMLMGHVEDRVQYMEDGDSRREAEDREYENTEEETRKSKKKKKKSKRTEDHEELVESQEHTAYSEDELSRKSQTEKWKVDEENGDKNDQSEGERSKRKKKKTVDNEDLPEEEETKTKKKKKKSKGKDRGV